MNNNKIKPPKGVRQIFSRLQATNDQANVYYSHCYVVRWPHVRISVTALNHHIYVYIGILNVRVYVTRSRAAAAVVRYIWYVIMYTIYEEKKN